MTATTSDATTPTRTTGPTLRRRLNLLLGISAAVFVIAGTLFGLSLRTATELRNEVVDQITTARLATRDLRTGMVDQETGVRGFALTGDPSFLDPYHRGEASAADALATLAPLVAGNRRLERDLATVEQSIAAWRERSAVPAIEAIERGDDVMRGLVFQDDSRVRFDQLRTDIDALDTRLTDERDRYGVRLANAERLVAASALAMAVTAVVAGVLIYVSLRRSVLAPLDRLGSDARHVASGDLERVIVPAGPPELASIGGDVELMRERIVAELDEVSSARDAIEHQAAELARSNQDLEQFAYVASHDLQEPLRKIAGFCQLLQKRYGGQLDERADEYIYYVVDGTKRMQDLINDLLAFSRVGRTTERFTAVDLGRAVDTARRDLEVSLTATGSHVERDELPEVSGDQRLLVTLFVNLIGNAVKFRGEDPPAVSITHVVDGSMCEVTVADNGIGIDIAYAEQIFVLFKRLHARSEFEGTGIGLALCKRIVEFHGGRIWLVDDGRPGTSLRFTLPLADPGPRPAPDTDPDPDTGPDPDTDPDPDTGPDPHRGDPPP